MQLSGQLEVEAPKLRTGVVQRDSQFPTPGAFMPAPNDTPFAGILIDEVDHPNSITDPEFLR